MCIFCMTRCTFVTPPPGPCAPRPLSCSVGRDKAVKYWDMDRWELLLDLPGHHADVQSLAIAQYGDFVVTGETLARPGRLSNSVHVRVPDCARLGPPGLAQFHAVKPSCACVVLRTCPQKMYNLALPP